MLNVLLLREKRLILNSTAMGRRENLTFLTCIVILTSFSSFSFLICIVLLFLSDLDSRTTGSKLLNIKALIEDNQHVLTMLPSWYLHNSYSYDVNASMQLPMRKITPFHIA